MAPSLDDNDSRTSVSAKGRPGASQSSVSDSGNLYQWIFENLQDIFFRTDPAGNILLASPSAQRLMQFQMEEIIGRNIRTFSPTPNMFDRLAKIVLERDFVEKFEVQLRRKDRSLFWVAINARIFRNTEDAVVGIDGIYRDISIR
ncbi:MAG: PAS domain-containing protein, partial [Desulfobacterales bacterium]|nr:PAS domain-containing protein [Desulfobacterales bacterium]